MLSFLLFPVDVEARGREAARSFFFLHFLPILLADEERPVFFPISLFFSLPLFFSPPWSFGIREGGFSIPPPFFFSFLFFFFSVVLLSHNGLRRRPPSFFPFLPYHDRNTSMIALPLPFFPLSLLFSFRPRQICIKNGFGGAVRSLFFLSFLFCLLRTKKWKKVFAPLFSLFLFAREVREENESATFYRPFPLPPDELNRMSRDFLSSSFQIARRRDSAGAARSCSFSLWCEDIPQNRPLSSFSSRRAVLKEHYSKSFRPSLPPPPSSSMIR